MYDARGDVTQYGEWSYDADGNTLVGRVWYGSDEIIESYAYDADGNTTLYIYYSNLSGEVTESEESWAYDAEGNVVSYSIEDDEDTYGLKNLYDELDRTTSSTIDLDFDTLETLPVDLVILGDEWPWSYTADLNALYYDEIIESQEGVYTCD